MRDDEMDRRLGCMDAGVPLPTMAALRARVRQRRQRRLIGGGVAALLVVALVVPGLARLTDQPDVLLEPGPTAPETTTPAPTTPAPTTAAPTTAAPTATPSETPSTAENAGLLLYRTHRGDPIYREGSVAMATVTADGDVVAQGGFDSPERFFPSVFATTLPDGASELEVVQRACPASCPRSLEQYEPPSNGCATTLEPRTGVLLLARVELDEEGCHIDVTDITADSGVCSAVGDMVVRAQFSWRGSAATAEAVADAAAAACQDLGHPAPGPPVTPTAPACADDPPAAQPSRARGGGFFAHCIADLAGPDQPLYRLQRAELAPTGGIREDLESALRAYLDGPTPEETEAGYVTALPSGSSDLLRDVVVSDGAAVIDLTRGLRAVNNLGASAMSLAFLAELDAVVFQFPEITTYEPRLESSCEDFGAVLEGTCMIRERQPA